ncbi:hypothetical protein BD410DRAFT_845465, partial [Rickenella mellea]
EAENRELDVEEEAVDEGIHLAEGHQHLIVEEGGIRVENDDEEERDQDSEETKEAKKKLKRKRTAECNAREARYLSRFASTTGCLRNVWDDFFGNQRKVQLSYPDNTTYQRLEGALCCNNCTPRLFPVEKITMEKVPGLKRGKKKDAGNELVETIRKGLDEWRDNELIDTLYPDTTSITPDALMSDDVIERLALSNDRILDATALRRCVRWMHAFEDDDNTILSPVGHMLLRQLLTLYDAYDAMVSSRPIIYRFDNSASMTPEQFYATSTSTRGGRGKRGVRGRGGQDSTQEKQGNASGTGTRARGTAQSRGRGTKK